MKARKFVLGAAACTLLPALTFSLSAREAVPEPAPAPPQEQTQPPAPAAPPQEQGQAPAGTAGAGTQTQAQVDANLVLGVNLNEHSVRNQAGEEIGSVEEVAVDASTGRIRFLSVGVGGFLGIGDTDVAVPWEAVKVEKKAAGEFDLVVNIDKAKLEKAPRFEKTKLAEMTESQWLEQTYSFFGLQSPKAEAPEAMPGIVLSSQLNEEEVKGSGGEDIGSVEEIVFNTATGEIAFVIVGVGGFLGIGDRDVAVPFNAFQLRKDNAGAPELVLNATKQQLEGAPHYVSGEFTPALNYWARTVPEKALPPIGEGPAPAP